MSDYDPKADLDIALGHIKNPKKRRRAIELAYEKFSCISGDPPVIIGEPVRNPWEAAYQHLIETEQAYGSSLLNLDSNDAHDQGTQRSDEWWDHCEACTEELLAWAKGPFRLGRPTESRLHQIVESMQQEEDGILVPLVEKEKGFEDRWFALTDKFKTKQIGQGAQVFVLQHDWAAAFEKATDFAIGEYHMPAEIVALELLISGKHVCGYFLGSDCRPESSMLFCKTKVGWVLCALGRLAQDGSSWLSAATEFQAVTDLVHSQLRAMAISLEAEVAVTELVHAPYKLNSVREKSNKPPLHSYHVVNLAKRRQYAPLPAELSDASKRRSPRLHFRRGHYRHFENHKTWIKWMLVGDPDLGFVDKHYKL